MRYFVFHVYVKEILFPKYEQLNESVNRIFHCPSKNNEEK